MAWLWGDKPGRARRSFLASADPRLKIVAVTLWSILLALTGSLPAALAGLAGSLILVLLAGLGAGELLRRLLAVNFFLLFVWLALPFSFSSPGEIVAAWGPLEITRPGLILSCLFTIKANAVTLGAMAFLSGSSVFQLAAAARRLGAPEKLTAIFAMMFRYVQLIGEEYERLRLAMKARGFRSKMNMHSYRSWGNLIALLLVRSVERAERIEAAMRCRGYRGRFWLADDFQFRAGDWALSALMLALGAVVLGCAFL